MTARRVAYAAFLAAAFFYYIMFTTYISWALLAFAAALPALSVLLAALLAGGKCRVKITHSAEGTAPGVFYVYAELRPTARIASVRLVLRMKNLLTGDVVVCRRFLVPGKRAEIPYESQICGLVQVQMKRPMMMDLLGVVGIPAGEEQRTEVLLLPGEIPFEGAPESLTDGCPKEPISAQGPRGGMETREWKDVRAYRQGDPVRDIHWKLSARRGGLVVREFEKAESGTAVIVFESGDSPARIHEATARLIGLAHRFLEFGYGLAVFWGRGEDARRYAVWDEKTLKNMLRDVMKTRAEECGAEEAERPSSPAEDGRAWLLVSPGSVVRYSGDAPMGEVN